MPGAWPECNRTTAHDARGGVLLALDRGRGSRRVRQAGDGERVAQLAAFGPALQKRLHRQGFGTAPVDDLLAGMQDELAGIAEQAGVDVIVSRWALAYRGPRARSVDVTSRQDAEVDRAAARDRAAAARAARRPGSLTPTQ
jgi:hypothetical protein